MSLVPIPGANCRNSWLIKEAATLSATLDARNNAPAFAARRAKNLKAGLATWVRSNQVYEISI